ncbi:MAG: hypothetical protein GXP19_01760 [Gammaproteobacteria bacterium]|nr:hypothetical protein [Gammaproteobacteria bacterium]
MLRSLLAPISLVFLISCSTGVNKIKKQYYDIDIINGIDKDEAITTALYYASLDEKFGTSSTKNISSSVVDNGQEWRVSLAHKSNGAPTISYLVNKRSGNATSLTENTSKITAPINFISSFESNTDKAGINSLENHALSASTKPQEKENFQIGIDEEPVRSLLDLPNKSAETQNESVLAFPNRDILASSDASINIDIEEPARSFDLSEAQEIQNEALLAFPNRDISAPADENIDIDIEEPVQSLDLSNKTTETEKESVIAFSDYDISEPSDQRIDIDTDELISILSSNSRITSKTTNKSATKTFPKAMSKPIPKEVRTREIKEPQENNGPILIDAFPRDNRQQELEMSTIIDESARDITSVEVKIERNNNAFTSRPKESNRQPAKSRRLKQQTSLVSDSPSYKLKLLTGGFEKDLNNHITLKPDYDMDFSENISGEITKEAIQRIVITPEPIDDFEAQPTREFEDEPNFQPDPAPRPGTEFSLERNQQIARLSLSTSADEIIESRGNTITFEGAVRGNKGVIKLMDDTLIEGYRTSVTVYKLNGIEITKLAKYLELPTGKHTLVSRCFSTYDEAYNEDNNVFENEIELLITNAHEYILEAQTYRFNGNVECSASIYDIRDMR